MSILHTSSRPSSAGVPLTNLGKVLYPASGTTKGEVLDYYLRISPLLLPHVRNHPLTLKRYPDGVEEEFFYEKRCPSHRPDWVSTCSVQRSSGKPDLTYCRARTLRDLLWIVNLGSLELHPLLGTCSHPERPRLMVFDLDPGEGADLYDCVVVAREVAEMLDALGLSSFAKTSGGKGLHLWVPLNTSVTYDETKPFAHAVARLMERRMPKLLTSVMAKDRRVGRVLIDWSQNSPTKTTAAPYSLRAMSQPTVSTPVAWSELDEVRSRRDAARLRFTMDDVLDRCERMGDLFEETLTLRQRLPEG